MPPKGTTRKRTQLQDSDDVEALPTGKKARHNAPHGSSPTTTPATAPARGRKSRVTSGSATKGEQTIHATSALELHGDDNTAKQSHRPTRNVYEVPDSGDELSVPALETPAVVVNTASKPQSSARLATSTKAFTARKRTTAKQDVEAPVTEPSRPQTAPEPPTPSKATPSKAKPKTKSQILRELRQAGTRGVQNLAEIQKAAQEVPVEPPPPQLTPHGRKHFADHEPLIALGTPLKSILSPQKKTRPVGRPRKNVAFDKGQNAVPAEVSFGDIPLKTAAKAAKPSKKAVQVQVPLEGPSIEANGREGMEEEDDEEVCSMCKKPDSKRGNQILFCDGCDMAVHQKCYGVPTVPRGDWFCRNCLQDDAVAPQAGGAVHVSTVPAESEDKVPDIPGFEQHLRAMQRVLIDRCTGRRRIPLRGQDEAYEKAFQLVEQTVLAGEGNSMLVIGARGCGKTTLVESVVSKLATDHGDEFHVVRLNGFIHTDDKIALKEIWRQLGKEMEVEDDLISRTNNYADTLASLLAVLSHPSEIVDTHQGVTSKSVIFIIDEFDLFATHARQTLLYNLFDIAQARKAPIAVLGLTTRIDVVETLEKRVKSRFSHRYVYLSLAKSIPAFWDVCKQGLTVEEEDLKDEGIDTRQSGFSKFLDWWDGEVDSLHKAPLFLDNLEYHFHSTKSVSSFLTTAVLPLSSLTATSPSLTRHFAQTQTSLSPPDSKLHLLSTLSDLDLSLLIAAARLDIVAHTDTVNFAMAYDEYTSLMGRQRVQSASSGLLALGGGARVWGRGVAGCSWERLVDLGLLVPAGLVGRGAGGAGGIEGKMWRVDVALEEIPGYVRLNAVLAKWCREI